MLDRRKLKRRHLIYYLRVFDRNSVNLLGHLVDITAEGIMLISEKPLEVNQTHHLRMVLPKEISNTEQLSFDAISRWCGKDVNPAFYDTGFQLIDFPDENKRVIEQLISEFGFRD